MNWYALAALGYMASFLAVGFWWAAGFPGLDAADPDKWVDEHPKEDA